MTGKRSDAVAACDYHRNELEASEGPGREGEREERVKGICYIRTAHARADRIGFKGAKGGGKRHTVSYCTSLSRLQVMVQQEKKGEERTRGS